ncbi:hypothetical protein [Sphingobacterium siyangense]|uniref:DUF3828 domain-containing protein n=1 Tax=Sphingobacterium siyangense TaxID=459529 RepID=A0A562MZX9_9SPHI|nr:hypothetical protein [Sphingobacterium siyangense]TWI25489.1 hypothetical protein IQ31_00054 [Sphingobacterium siyangense]
MKSLYATIGLFCMLASCTNSAQDHKSATANHPAKQIPIKDSTRTAEQDTAVGQNQQAEAWLKGIFQCTGSASGKYCYYLDKEGALCTKRFQAFLKDANEIYGPSNLTDEELPKAEAAYKAKWGKIYPLYTAETWLFGRGNDDALDIKDVKIDRVTESKFIVFIDYGNDIRTKNEVQLVNEQGSYKIDYCKTTFLH